jgi:2-amino-4-hydroxy-6-hydroxymethyldihydropteridine diphosphokinase
VATAYVSLGSNINPRRNIVKALRLLSGSQFVLKVSTVFRTKPERERKQPYYYNCVVSLKTDASPKTLKSGLLKPIESLLGRKRMKDKFASRPIDLDLIAYNNKLLDPDIVRRPYLASCLKELNPGLKIDSVIEKSRMRPLAGYTGFLREQLAGWKRKKP